MEQTTNKEAAKSRGIHYTPPDLARFLAEVTVNALPSTAGELKILDPACGDGALLQAFADAIPKSVLARCVLVGYEMDAAAAQLARKRLKWIGAADVCIKVRDFLAMADSGASAKGRVNKPNRRRPHPEFDVLIANPPYVRTQVLGSVRAQSLAREFDLTGRVDLYHAFIRAMASALRPGATMGLLTSNRFLSIKSGEATRKRLLKDFNLRKVFDLGDTKLFKAAVLPVIVVGQRCDADDVSESRGETLCTFDRVYEHRRALNSDQKFHERNSVLDSLREPDDCGLVRTPRGVFQLERGELIVSGKDSIWSLSTPDYQQWLELVRRHTHCSFDDVARVRVGIKTTADEVFVRDDWQSLPTSMQPESQVIRPLIRHFDADRWFAQNYTQSVLYPHEVRDGKREAIDLARFPKAGRYLRLHHTRLNQRHYLIESGRQWHEIWVPHSPHDWAEPKIVYPDISAEPRFFLDQTGAVVNGDCYWITRRPGVAPDLLLLMLAVANSTFMTKFYDIAFHNKLYAGRRRYMTQYVKKFPMPDPGSPLAREIVDETRSLIKNGVVGPAREAHINRLVWQSFGFAAED